jgi:ElaB/YqjD/DUF883 family membrane-anchored ribosome-binding protein
MGQNNEKVLLGLCVGRSDSISGDCGNIDRNRLGSGPGGLKPNVILLQKYLKDRGYDPKGIDGGMGKDTVAALNQFLYDKGAKGEKEIVDLIWNNRAKQLKGYSSAKDHLKGWMNRMNDWYTNSSDRIKEFIKDNPTGTGILGSVMFLAGLLLLSKKFIK